MPTPSWLDALFAAVDRGDAESFLGHLTPDARFTFGNAPPIDGQAAIRQMLTGFFASIAGARHTIEDRWGVDDAVIVRGRVSYTRLDGSTYAVPFANIFKLVGDRIQDYRVYVDNHELYRETP